MKRTAQILTASMAVFLFLAGHASAQAPMPISCTFNTGNTGSRIFPDTICQQMPGWGAYVLYAATVDMVKAAE